jgi:nitroreductase
LIEAARLAPSGNNVQPWRFKIIKDDETKELLRKHNIFTQDFVYTAPVIIVCCTDHRDYKQTANDDPNELRAIRDLPIASEHIVLRATELGLGTCYVGWVEKEKIKDVLGIPKELIVPFVITVGYAADKGSPRPKKSKEDILL